MYKYGKYPLGAVGPIKFLWTTQSDGENQRNGIVFCHPSIASIFIEEVKRFNTSRSEDSDKVLVKHNLMEFVVLRLTGNQSAQFLSNILHLPDRKDEKQFQFKKEIQGATGYAILNCVVDDPRIFIPRKKQNPTKSTKTGMKFKFVLWAPSFHQPDQPYQSVFPNRTKPVYGRFSV